MAAFDKTTDLYNFFRQNAQKFGCRECFDDKISEIEKMNENGSNGVLRFLCKVNSPCPCATAPQEIKDEGCCYCEIFVREYYD